MIQPNGQNGNGRAATIQEAAASETVIGTPAAGDALGQGPELATRAKQRTRPQIQQNRFVIIAAGAIVVALLIFVATSMPRKRSAPTSKNGAAATTQDANVRKQRRTWRQEPVSYHRLRSARHKRETRRISQRARSAADGDGAANSRYASCRTGKYRRNAGINTALRRAAELASAALPAADKRKQCG